MALALAAVVSALSAGPVAAQSRSSASGDSLADALVTWATHALEVAGIAVLVIGILVATAFFGRRLRAGGDRSEAFRSYRSDIGRAILLGLEFLVAADIVNTVAVEPTLRSLAVLAGVVLIRTFLSFSLEIEIEGRPPWRRAAAEEARGGPRPE